MSTESPGKVTSNRSHRLRLSAVGGVLLACLGAGPAPEPSAPTTLDGLAGRPSSRFT